MDWPPLVDRIQRVCARRGFGAREPFLVHPELFARLSVEIINWRDRHLRETGSPVCDLSACVTDGGREVRITGFRIRPQFRDRYRPAAFWKRSWLPTHTLTWHPANGDTPEHLTLMAVREWAPPLPGNMEQPPVIWLTFTHEGWKRRQPTQWTYRYKAHQPPHEGQWYALGYAKGPPGRPGRLVVERIASA